jgi:hypothetical protein
VGRIALQETPRRTGHFDIAGAVTSTLGMVGIVFGLVSMRTKSRSCRCGCSPAGRARQPTSPGA